MENPSPIANSDQLASQPRTTDDLLKDFGGANFNCKSLLDSLEAVNAQISERELSYQDVLSALQNGKNNGCGPSPNELQRYAKVLWTQISEMNECARKLRSDIMCLLNQTYSVATDTFLSLINCDLYGWKVKQKFAQIGPRCQTEAVLHELNQLDPFFETYGEYLRRFMHHIAILEKDFNQYGMVNQNEELQAMKNSSASLMEDFIKQSVVITQQPPSYLMKTRQPTGGNSNKASGKHPCQPALRVLGGHNIGCRTIQPKDRLGEVKCFLISEEQAKNVNAGRDLDEKLGCGKLLHNTAVFGMSSPKEYCAEFKRPLQLISIDRPADEHEDGVLSHVPRERDEGVPWPDVAEALKYKFMQLIEGQKTNETAQYTLTDANLLHIAERLKLPGSKQNYDCCRLRWERFFQIPLENLRRENDDTPVPFWEWFYKTAEIVQKYLLFQWNKGVRSETLLSTQINSSLMVKFSDTQFGFLIISYRFPGAPVQHLRVRAEDLARIPLENCVLDIPDLKNVESIYPGHPVSEFRPATIKKEKNGRKSPDKQNQGNSDGCDPYFKKVSIGFRVEGTPVWDVPTPPLNWDPMDFQDFLQNIDMME